MIVEYIRYHIKGDTQAFENAYRLAQEQLKDSPHCQSWELARCHEEPARYILRITWDSLEGHLQGFRTSPIFRDFVAHVRPYINQIEEMQHYVVTDVVG